MGRDSEDSWWFDTSALPTLLWARLRVLAAGAAEVFDLDGRTTHFDRAEEAETFLGEDEYSCLDDLVEEDWADYGFSFGPPAPPSAASDEALLELMVQEPTPAAGQVLARGRHCRRMQHVDGLTGLPTHHEIATSLGALTSVWAVAFDIAALSLVGDSFGHMRSDEVLVCVARALEREGATRSGTTFRIGGDEFLILLPSSDRAGAVDLARAGIQAVAALALEFRHQQYPARDRVEVNAVVFRAHAGLAEDIGKTREWIAAEIHEAKRGEWDRAGVIADPGRAMPS